MAAITHVADLDSASNEYFSRADETLTSITGDLTIEMWLRVETAPGADATYALLHKRETTGNQRSYDVSYRDESGVKKIVVQISSDGAAGTEVEGRFTYTLTALTWFHVAVVYTASAGSVELFINGVSQSTITGFPTSIFNSTQSLEIGRRGGGSYYNGMMSLIRLWSTTRTATQILDSMNRTLGSTSNLVAEWTLANTENDNSGNSLTLINNSTVAYVTTSYPPINIQLPTANIASSFPTLTPALSQSVTLPAIALATSCPVPSGAQTDRSERNVDKSSEGTWATLNKS